MKISQYRYIAVEGPIGVGKTTLARSLAKEMGGRLVVEEPVDEGILTRYYSNIKRYAFQTQVYFLASRYKQIQDLRHDTLFDLPFMVADYIFEKDLIFAQCFLSPGEYQVYENLYKSLAKDIISPEFVILLQADVDVMMDRIGMRGNRFESHISREYMMELIDGYDKFFFNYVDAPLLIINTNDMNYRDNTLDVKEIIHQIERHDTGGIQYYVPLGK